MKIIFLDVDGVLNHELWFKESRKNKKVEEDYDLTMFDPEKIELLNHIIRETGAKIVISSTWRKGRSIDELKELCIKVNLEGEIIGKTPNLSFNSFYINESDVYSSTVPRGCEIKAWLDINKSLTKVLQSPLKYVILDDDSDMLFGQKENYFRVDSFCGLTNNLAYRVINYLNN